MSIANYKATLKRLYKDLVFRNIVEKLATHGNLNDSERQYALSLSIIFHEQYREEESRYYFEFSYYLLLNYSISTGDYIPLYDFCISNGFYPVAKLILDQKLIETSIFDAFYYIGLGRYTVGEITSTFEQKDNLDKLLHSISRNRAFIAPTSFGKSEFIVRDIQIKGLNKVGIIVPKKALIWETYSRMKFVAKEYGYRVLLHDTEYNSNAKFLAIFTQERALRLLQENNTYFDMLYIDEAHNLFEANNRNILLARLIRLNHKLNPNNEIVYLSPLINDSSNLINNTNTAIQEQKISYNIKELMLVYYATNEGEYLYNRFVDEYTHIGNPNIDWIEYIKSKTQKKSLLYAYKPKDVQDIALSYAGEMHYIDAIDIQEIAFNLEKYVDKEYYVVELLKKGIIFVHGKVPDSIRDYLIAKFKTIVGIKYLVSNSSVLEGVNFPIDSLFIMNTYGLTKNNLVNLTGRVNRLNEIFIESKDIKRLICPIYFVQTSKFGGATSFKNKIELLRSTDTIDEVYNPVLPKSSKPNPSVLERENLFIDNYSSTDMRLVFIKNGIDGFYVDFDQAYTKIVRNISEFHDKEDNTRINNSNIFTTIRMIFGSGFEYFDFSEYEVGRIIKEKACNFYNLYLSTNYFGDIKRKIKFFMSTIAEHEANNDYYYIGTEFGEIENITSLYPGPHRKAYIDLKRKSYRDKVNLAIMKSKIEDDLIGYKFARYVKSLYDLKIVDEETFNMFNYGTTQKDKIVLLQSGLSHQVIKFIEDNNLFNDIKMVDYGFEVTDNFRSRLVLQDDFVRYEIEKLIY